MWQTDWAESPRQTADIEGHRLPLWSLIAVRSAYLLSWSEHCIECAVPDCYALCPLYVSRRDRKCARFKNGISPNPQYPGLFQFGAEIEFRRWGKLESTFGFGSVKPRQARLLDRIDRCFLHAIRPISSVARGVSPKLRMNGAYAVLRERLLQAYYSSRREDFDEFVIEVWNLAVSTCTTRPRMLANTAEIPHFHFAGARQVDPPDSGRLNEHRSLWGIWNDPRLSR